MPLIITRATAPTDAIRRLFAEIEEFFGLLYPPEQRHGASLDAIFSPHIAFFTAAEGDEVIGCAGIALAPEFGEVKRMYVREAWRGTGAAQKLLAQLESTASGAGLTLLRLETGIHQHAALKFYTRQGFIPCGAFPPYNSLPQASALTSLFFEKHLARVKS